MKKSILIPLPHRDFDPTEVAIPWKRFSKEKLKIVFATPLGMIGEADPVMVTGKSLGPLKHLLMADGVARAAYKEMIKTDEFQNPRSYQSLRAADFDALLLPGGHAPGVREFIESPTLHGITLDFFKNKKPVGAICHGVLVAARTIIPGTTKSVLHDKKTTALPAWMENCAFQLTRLWKGNYYKTYPLSVQAEVQQALSDSKNFFPGPLSLLRDSPQRQNGFIVRDGHYVSARWPGDAHALADELVGMIKRLF